MQLVKPAGVNKYGARKVQLDGYTFDSAAEAKRYQDLCLLERAGEIRKLVVHPSYELQRSFKMDGVRYAAIRYEADFEYKDSSGQLVIEDVKGIETPVFKIKKKMFLYKFGNRGWKYVVVEV